MKPSKPPKNTNSMAETSGKRKLHIYTLRGAKLGQSGVETGPGGAKMEQKSPPWRAQMGQEHPKWTSMGSQAGAEATQMQFKSGQVHPQGPGSDFGAVLGCPKGPPNETNLGP